MEEEPIIFVTSIISAVRGLECSKYDILAGKKGYSKYGVLAVKKGWPLYTCELKLDALVREIISCVAKKYGIIDNYISDMDELILFLKNSNWRYNSILYTEICLPIAEMTDYNHMMTSCFCDDPMSRAYQEVYSKRQPTI